MDFNKDEVYSSTLRHRAVPNYSGNTQERTQEFYTAIQNYFASLALDNMQLTNESINIGGSFFGSNSVPALGLSYKKGKLKKLSAFFLVTRVGNVFNFSLYQQASFGFFDILTGVTNPSEKVSVIQNKLKTIEEAEEFSIFNAVAEILYEEGIGATNF